MGVDVVPLVDEELRDRACIVDLGDATSLLVAAQRDPRRYVGGLEQP